jgi:hypothetical protein
VAAASRSRDKTIIFFGMVKVYFEISALSLTGKDQKTGGVFTLRRSDFFV